jgi:UDPglucose 6-dehydrogenase
MKLKMAHRISVIGMGYVGIGNALMLAKRYQVSIVDLNQKKIEDFNSGRLPIKDSFAQSYFDEHELDISATTNLEESIKDSSFIILALPTDFDEINLRYDTASIENVVEKTLEINNKATIIIKSTVNIGYTDSLKQKFSTERIIFSPEFLREGNALKDCLNPSRIIIGGRDDLCNEFAELLINSNDGSSAPILLMESKEAECVKLFANSYLAMRVSFFNELDSFCLDNKINPKEVIDGVCLDDRIGAYYNNPSFGFGGLCLPKDSLQLLYRFGDSPKSIIKAIQDSNKERALFIINKILIQKPKTVGVYKLEMKTGSDNSRNSSIHKIIKSLIENKIEIIIYDTSIKLQEFKGAQFIDDFKTFTENSDLIITNRIDAMIQPFSQKVFSRDIFSRD